MANRPNTPISTQGVINILQPPLVVSLASNKHAVRCVIYSETITDSAKYWLDNYALELWGSEVTKNEKGSMRGVPQLTSNERQVLTSNQDPARRRMAAEVAQMLSLMQLQLPDDVARHFVCELHILFDLKRKNNVILALGKIAGEVKPLSWIEGLQWRVVDGFEQRYISAIKQLLSERAYKGIAEAMLESTHPEYMDGVLLNGRLALLPALYNQLMYTSCAARNVEWQQSYTAKQGIGLSAQFLDTPLLATLNAYWPSNSSALQVHNIFVQLATGNVYTAVFMLQTLLDLLTLPIAVAIRAGFVVVQEGRKARETRLTHRLLQVIASDYLQLLNSTLAAGASAVHFATEFKQTRYWHIWPAEAKVKFDMRALLSVQYYAAADGEHQIAHVNNLLKDMNFGWFVHTAWPVNFTIKAKPVSDMSVDGGWLRHAVTIGSYTIEAKGTQHPEDKNIILRLFPISHRTDAGHFTLRVTDMIHGVGIVPKLLGRVDIRKVVPNQVLKDINANVGKTQKMLAATLRYIPVGTPDQRVTATLINSIALTCKREYMACFVKSRLMFASPTTVTDRFKAHSIMLRRCAWLPGIGNVDDSIVATLAYQELSSGRGNHTSDWKNEYDNRCTAKRPIYVADTAAFGEWTASKDQRSRQVNQEQHEAFIDKLRQHVRGICVNLLEGYTANESLRDFYRRRHEWMSSGSATGTNLGKLSAAARADEKLSSLRVNKRVWADHTHFSTIEKAFKGKPMEQSSASEKYENGKSRALYGVEPVHYVINTYATKGLEGRLKLLHGFEKGSSNFQVYYNEKRRALITGRADVECTMFDYADFNVQHTPEAQAVIFEELAAVGRSRGFHADWIKANEWVAAAKQNMFVKMPNSPHLAHAKQGMFSGTRSTDFINTILNLAYFNIAAETVAKRYNVCASNLYHVHQGDDVWVSNENTLWARLVYYQLNAMGFEFQSTKQMFGVGRGEYLRILYSEGRSLGYTQRALINFILRPLQNDEVADIRALAAMNSDSFALLHRRQFSIYAVRLLWLLVIDKWYVIRAGKADRQPLRIPATLVAVDIWHGGLNCAMPLTSAVGVTRLPAVPNLRWHADKLEHVQGKMADDWVAHISPTFHRQSNGEPINAQALKKAAFESDYTEVARSVNKVSDLALYKAGMLKVVKQLGKYKAILSTQETLGQAIAFVEEQGKRPGVVAAGECNAMVAVSMAMDIGQDLTRDAPSEGVAPQLGHNIAKYEASSVFKSVDAAATALGVSKREAIKKLVHMDTALSISAEDIALLVLNRANQATDTAMDYLLNRQVGFATVFNPFMSGSMVGLLHAAVVQMLINRHNLAEQDERDLLAAEDAAALHSVVRTLRKDVQMSAQLAY